MGYFNYHAKVKKLILEGKLEGYEFVDNYNGISPALVLYFSDSKPMPIRKHRWEEYLPFLMSKCDKIVDLTKIDKKQNNYDKHTTKKC